MAIRCPKICCALAFALKGLFPPCGCCPRRGLAPLNPRVDREWFKLLCWVQWWSILAFALVFFELAAAHLPLIITYAEHGKDGAEYWLDCGSKPKCIISDHVLILPIGYILWMAWFGLNRFAKNSTRTFLWATYFAAPLILSYCFLENNLLLDVTNPNPGLDPHSWEAPIRGALTACFYLALGFTLAMGYNLTMYVFNPDRPDVRRPRSIADVVSLVMEARSNRKTLRVQGSGHSVPASIWGKTNTQVESVLHVSLELMTSVQFLGDGMVYAEAGCNLGHDPANALSSWDNSLCKQLDDKGLALPDLGGISHQTVAGFLATGSSGGTLQHDLGTVIDAVVIVDGNGTVRTFSRDAHEGKDAFNAAVINVGLLGVVVGVRFNLSGQPKFNIIGQQVGVQLEGKRVVKTGLNAHNRANAQRLLCMNVFDQATLEHYLRSAEYHRFMWYPQTGVNRMVFWSARRAGPGEHVPKTKYKELPIPGLTGPLLHKIYDSLKSKDPPYDQSTVDGLGALLALFNPIDSSKVFGGPSYRVLPMDNQIPTDDAMMIDFTELWVPLDQAAASMNALYDFFYGGDGDPGLVRRGTFSFEFYSATASEFWLSRAHGTDVFRIDVFWFVTDRGLARPFFQQFWNLLKQRRIPFKCHLGKYLPDGPDFMDNVVPARFEEWKTLRGQMDPDNVFLTKYWADHFGLPHPRADAIADALHQAGGLPVGTDLEMGGGAGEEKPTPNTDTVPLLSSRLASPIVHPQPQ